MKKTKILAPALGILALSLAASVTGTVAWFSTSSSVTADGMNIKAQVASNLYIQTASFASGDFGSTPTAASIIAAANREVSPIITNWNGATPLEDTKATGMIPTSSADHINWQYVVKNDGVAAGGQVFTSSGLPSEDTFGSIAYGGAKEDSTTVNYSDLKSYVVVGRFYLALGDVDQKYISMTCNIKENNATGTSTLLNAVRVAVDFTHGSCEDTGTNKKTDAEIAVLPNQEFNGGNNDITYYPMKPDQTLGSAVTAKKQGTPVNLGYMTQQTTYVCTVYAWFEGQDQACMNLNSIYAGDYDIDFSFNVITAPTLG